MLLVACALLLPGCDLLKKKSDASSASSSSASDDDTESTSKPKKKSKGDDAPNASATAAASAAPGASASAAPATPASNAQSTCVKACDDLIAKMNACLPDGATQAADWRKNLGRMKAIDAVGLADMCINRQGEIPALKTCDATEKAPPSACAHLKFLCRQVMKYPAMLKALRADASAPHFSGGQTDCDNPGGDDESTCLTQLDAMKTVISTLKPYDQHHVLEGCP